MFFNVLSLSLIHCPERLLIDKAHLSKLFEQFSDYLGLQPVKQPTMSTVVSYDVPDDDGLTGFVLVGNGYLTIRTLPGEPRRSLSVNIGLREECETARLLS